MDASSPPLLSGLLDVQLQLLIPSAALIHVYLAPYSKVEESFNIQALHDWLFLGPWRIDEFDHVLFPGAVPRSFVPSIVLSVFSYPLLLVSKLLGHIQTSADVQLHLRYLLALLWSAALLFFIQRITPRLEVPFLLSGASAASARRWIKRALILLSASQFHLPFWASRTTPNGLATPGVLVALALLLPRGLAHERSQLAGLALLFFLAVVYRLELLGVVGGCGLYLIQCRLYVWREDTDPHPIESIGKMAAIAQGALTASGLLTLLVDTVIWRSEEWMVPELSAVKFNVLEGKSAEWGTSPWHAYLTSALPKLLSFAAPLAILASGLVLVQLFISSGAVQWQTTPRGCFSRIDNVKARQMSGSVPLAAFVLLPALHVGLLSLLAHKEWRFVAYVVPLLNVLAAVGASTFLVPTAYRSLAGIPAPMKKVLPLVPAGLLALTIATTTVSTLASRANYPGGSALAKLHALEHGSADQAHKLHIDVLPAMTGVTLFQSIHLSRPANPPFGLPSLLPKKGQAGRVWAYDKTESLPLAREPWRHFTHLLSTAPACRLPLEGDLPGEESLFEPVSGGAQSASATEFAGIYFKRTSPPSQEVQPKEDTTSSWLDFTLPLGLASLRSFDAQINTENRVRVKGISLSWGRRRGGSGGGDGDGDGGSQISVGLKLKEVVWICQRKAGAV